MPPFLIDECHVKVSHYHLDEIQIFEDRIISSFFFFFISRNVILICSLFLCKRHKAVSPGSDILHKNVSQLLIKKVQDDRQQGLFSCALYAGKEVSEFMNGSFILHFNLSVS